MNKNKKASLKKSQLNLTKALESLFGGKDVFPQKFPDGGPIIPNTLMAKETTSLGSPVNIQFDPTAIDYATKEFMIQNQTTGNNYGFDFNVTKDPSFGNGSMGFSSSNKIKSRDRYREKAYGGMTQEEQQNIDQRVGQINQTGDAISSVASMIPVIGPIIGGIAKVGGMALASGKREQLEFESRTQPVKPLENIYGNFANGGLVTNSFKQYNSGSHKSGNDQGIDNNGNPNNNATGGYIQNKENSYNFGGQTYVMSDTLVNPESGNKFNIDAFKLNKKYGNADTLPEEKNALDFGMSRLSKLNDGMRNLKEQVLKTCGGPTKKMMAYGGSIDPLKPLIPTVSDQIGTYPNILDIAPMYDNFRLNELMLNAELPGYDIKPISNRSTSKTVKEFIKDPSRSGSAFNANTVAIGLKGLGLVKSLSDAVADPEKESVIRPDYNKSDQQIYSTNIDYTQARQDALAATNMATNVNRSSSSGFQSFQGRQSMNFANLADQLGNIGMQENNQRSQLAMQRGQYETNKAVDTANRKYQNRIDNQMNKANADLADQKLFSELTQIGTSFNTYAETKKQIQDNTEMQKFYVNQGLMLLNSKYENFELDSDIIERLKSGKYTIDDVVKVKMSIDSSKK